ncbi:hypothetical protein BURPS1710b_0596 [Burkholderia pseudomallei 1710b]|uniref:Uncharacterized protein n=1 Tax=Burkholderia pseudomallei (strain 1710b) TaxID=320372 RepID=Q3JWP3_BURP1|nr:hypothetical protein BURPS1710b_0596 [Burkholderia pseudomallei 1710b]
MRCRSSCGSAAPRVYGAAGAADEAKGAIGVGSDMADYRRIGKPSL